MRVANPQPREEEHTAEPWRVFDNDAETFILSGETMVCRMTGTLPRQDAERIVACVNRLSEFPTSLLADDDVEAIITLKRPDSGTLDLRPSTLDTPGDSA